MFKQCLSSAGSQFTPSSGSNSATVTTLHGTSKLSYKIVPKTTVNHNLAPQTQDDLSLSLNDLLLQVSTPPTKKVLCS